MLARIYVGAALSGATLLLSGCGDRAASPSRPAPLPKAERGEQVARVTLHVEGMTQRLGLF
jgi:hypothetical protein